MLRAFLSVLIGLSVSGMTGICAAQEWVAEKCSRCTQLAPLHYQCDGGLCGDCCDCCRRWTINAELLWMGRSRADQQTMIVADVGGVDFRVLDYSDLVFDIEAGFRGGVTWRPLWLDGDREFEIAYFGLFDQTATQSFTVDPATPNLNSITHRFFGNTGGADTSYFAEYQSDLHSGEINLRGCQWKGFTPLVGFRWIQFNEQIEINESTTPTSGAFGEMRNNLFGAQMGLHKLLWGYGRPLRVEATAKAGVFQNDTDLHANTHTAGGFTNVLDRESGNTATSGEVHVTLIWQMTNHLSARFGYSGLWLNDVALIADQSDNFNFAGQGNLQLSSANFQGGHLGIECTW